MYTCIFMYLHLYTHTYIHTYTHTYTQLCIDTPTHHTRLSTFHTTINSHTRLTHKHMYTQITPDQMRTHIAPHPAPCSHDFCTSHCNTLQHTATHCNTLQHTSFAPTPSPPRAKLHIHLIHTTPQLIYTHVTPDPIPCSHGFCTRFPPYTHTLLAHKTATNIHTPLITPDLTTCSHFFCSSFSPTFPPPETNVHTPVHTHDAKTNVHMHHTRPNTLLT